MKTLVMRTTRHGDALGYSVKRGIRGYDVVRVAIPRCRACQFRNYLWGLLFFCAVLIGVSTGWYASPSRGIALIVGAVAGGIPAALIILGHRRLRGLRSLDAYPLLRQLRQDGWRDPD
jgi:hypothetical protein